MTICRDDNKRVQAIIAEDKALPEEGGGGGERARAVEGGGAEEICAVAGEPACRL